MADSDVTWDQIPTTGEAQEVLSLNGSRISALIVAHPDNVERIYVGFDDTVAEGKGIPLDPGDEWTTSGNPCYSGAVWVSAPDNVQEIVYVEVG